jgi:hypothetical protein
VKMNLISFWTKGCNRRQPSSHPCLLVPAILIGWLFQEPTQAQQPSIEIRVPGFVFQSGKKSSRGFKLTTSDVTLPDLNAIMSPTPLPKQNPVSKPQPQPQPTTVTKASSNTPRFGYGSGPVVPPPADPLVPIDPGYDDPQPTSPYAQPIPNQPVAPVPPPVQSNQLPPVGDPLLQLDATVTIPFAHNYYPRTYLPRVPYFYGPSCAPYHHHHCDPFTSSSSPLRGLFTSSRNYLSGCGNSSFYLRLGF